MGDDQVLHGDEPVAHIAGLVLGHVVDRDQAAQVAGDLDAREVGLAGVRILHQHGEVDRVAGDVRERMRRVHGERGEHREHLLAVVARQALLLGGGELVPAQQHDAFFGEVRQDVVDHVVRVLVLQAVRLIADRAQLLARAQAAGSGDGDAGVDAALEAGHADHEELIEVRCEDRGEIRALEDGLVLVLGEFQHALVEFHPAQLAVEETIGRQWLFVGPRIAAVILIRFGDMLRDLTAENRLRGCVKNLCHTVLLYALDRAACQRTSQNSTVVHTSRGKTPIWGASGVISGSVGRVSGT